jgi:hypothetical protein
MTPPRSFVVLSRSDTMCRALSTPVLAADLLSALQFDGDGRFLATGDQGGRIVLLQQSRTSNQVRRAELLCKHAPCYHTTSLHVLLRIGNLHIAVASAARKRTAL